MHTGKREVWCYIASLSGRSLTYKVGLILPSWSKKKKRTHACLPRHRLRRTREWSDDFVSAWMWGYYFFYTSKPWMMIWHRRVYELEIERLNYANSVRLLWHALIVFNTVSKTSCGVIAVVFFHAVGFYMKERRLHSYWTKENHL